MTKEVNIPILQAGMTASELMSLNPIGLERQLVLETDTRRAKVLDGVTNYNDLPYWFESGTATVNWGDIGGNIADQTDLATAFNNVYLAIDDKQDTLVNQVNIRSINGNSLLGSGDLTVSASISIGTAIGSATAGSILFAGVGGVLAQDNTNFNYNSTTGALTAKSLLSLTGSNTITLDAGYTRTAEIHPTLKSTGNYLSFFGDSTAFSVYSPAISFDGSVGARIFGVFDNTKTLAYNKSNSKHMAFAGSSLLGVNGLTLGESGYEWAEIYGNALIIGASKSAKGKISVQYAPTASANYGLVSLGSGAFDGSTAGFFTGSASGTVLAINAASGFAGDLANFQVAGADVYKFSQTSSSSTFQINAPSSKLWISGFGAGETSIVASSANSQDFRIGIAGTSSMGGTVSQLYFNKIATGGHIQIQPKGGTVATYASSTSPLTNIANTSGTSGLFNIQGTFAAGAGSAVFNPLGINYTINNSGAQSGTATGIFLNATETALNSMTHNLMDLQVGGSSIFKVTSAGNTTLAGTIRFGEFTVATLPSSPSVGDKCFVNDASGAAVVGSIVVGGGATRVEVVWAYGGAGWKITARY